MANTLMTDLASYYLDQLTLATLARQHNMPTYHVETAAEIDAVEMKKYSSIGVTAGASTPEFLITDVCAKLETL